MGQKLTERDELAEAPASGDFFHVVDVSDTTDNAGGTSKKVQAQYLTISDASTTVKGKVELATDAETITGTDSARAVTPSNITAKIDTDGTLAGNLDTRIPSQKAVKTYVDTEIAANPSGNTAPPNLLKNGNFINNSTNGYGSTPDDWTSSNANPVQGGIPALTKQNLIDGLGIATGDIEGLWPCNGFVNTDDIDDLSDNAYDLDTATHVPGTSSDGLIGTALDFEDSSSQYGTIASPTNLLIAGSQTFIAFVKPETLGTDDLIMGHNDSGNTVYARLGIGSANGEVYFSCSGLTTAIIVNSDVKIQTGKWYMIVGVYDSANSLLKIWVNGIKKQTTASGSHTITGTQAFSIGRSGALASNYYDGLVQNAAVLSVALSDDQVKKLFAMTMYKGQKIRRATTDAYLYEELNQEQVERLRGETVAFSADAYCESTNHGIYITTDGTGGTTTKAHPASANAWERIGLSVTVPSDATYIRYGLLAETTDGNSWFRECSGYVGSNILPYDHSKDDWSRFPRLLKMDIPAVISGYQFEEKKFHSYTPTGPTNTTMTGRFRIDEKICFVEVDAAVSGAVSFASLPTIPVVAGASKNSHGDHSSQGLLGYLDSGTANVPFGGAIKVNVSGTTFQPMTITTASYWSATAPITWANTDAWGGWMQYEID